MELSSSSSTGSSKRAKAPNVNQVVVSCLVDGCDSDLSQSREYHRRHKVCEPHSKTPMVTIAGRQQRFCQQCSRFHSLEEFDEGKRSCRKRLDGHNRRRRKPQSDSLPRSSSGIFFSTPQGTRVVSFGGGPQVHGNPGSNSAGWVVKAENESSSSSRSSLLFHNNALPYPVSSGYKEMNQFQFIQGNGHDQSILPAASNRMLFCDGGGRALSLLSSSPANQTRDVGELQYGGVGQLLFPSTNYSSHNKVGVEVSDDGDLSAHPNNNNDNDNTTLHFHSMFQDAPDGSSPTAGAGGASHQTLSFGW